MIDEFVAKNQNKNFTNSALLSVVLEKYIKESSKNWKDKTIQKTEEDYRNKIQLFIDIIGDKLGWYTDQAI